MTINTIDTMLLYHNHLLLGTLTRYGYETPWASAWLVPLDQASIAYYAAIHAFLLWVESIPDELSDTEADQLYEQELVARELSLNDVERFWNGWQVQMPNGEMREISLYSFEDDGYLTWRW